MNNEELTKYNLNIHRAMLNDYIVSTHRKIENLRGKDVCESTLLGIEIGYLLALEFCVKELDHCFDENGIAQEL